MGTMIADDHFWGPTLSRIEQSVDRSWIQLNLSTSIDDSWIQPNMSQPRYGCLFGGDVQFFREPLYQSFFAYMDQQKGTEKANFVHFWRGLEFPKVFSF